MMRVRGDRGAALLITIMTLLLLSALAAALILSSTSESIIAAHFRDGVEARYAAEAALVRALDEAVAAADWAPLIDGSSRSAWVDGPPAGTRSIGDGSTIDLTQVVNLAGCQKTTACAASELAAVTADRPWGAGNPRWTLYAFGPLRALLAPGAIDASQYVVVLAGNGPQAEHLALRAEAFGVRGAHAVIEATAARDYNESGQSIVKILSWRELR